MYDWKDIIEELNKGKTFMLYPHVNVDGDGAGSCLALARMLSEMGKECRIYLGDELPAYLSFLDCPFFVMDPLGFSAEVAIAVDCGEDGRLPGRLDTFMATPVRLCIDHHIKTKPFDVKHIMNDPHASACGMMILDLFRAMGRTPSKEEAEALYVAIITDTGCFKYSNTTAETHAAIAELYGCGIDHSRLCNMLYENKPFPKIKLEAEIIKRARFFAGGKACLSYATQEMLDMCGAVPGHSEGCVDILRSIEGVEIAIFIKQQQDGNYRASMRAKDYADVAAVALPLGGGGHVRAAGCSFSCGLDEVIDILVPAVEAELARHTDI